MGNSMGTVLAMFAFVLMALMGLFYPDIPMADLCIRSVVGLAIFWVLGKIYSNIGRDLFREAIEDAKARRDEQAERTRALLEDEESFQLDLPTKSNKKDV